MVKRIITSVVALAVFVGILFLPPICFTVALAAVILFMLYECYSATKADLGMKTIGFISAVILMSSIYFCKAIEWDTFAWATASIGIIFIIALHMITVVAKHGKRNYKDILSNGFLTIYIVLSMSCVWLAKETFDTATMLLTFICAWSCDNHRPHRCRAYAPTDTSAHIPCQPAQDCGVPPHGSPKTAPRRRCCRCNGYMYCISIDCEKCI